MPPLRVQNVQNVQNRDIRRKVLPIRDIDCTDHILQNSDNFLLGASEIVGLDFSQFLVRLSMLHWRSLVTMSHDELALVDIAELNPACAEGLPGAKVIEVEKCLKRIDEIANNLRMWTKLYYNEIYLKAPQKYECSEAKFRVETMIKFVQSECGIRYDHDKKNAKPTDPWKLGDAFIHDALLGPGGTCLTLPIVYVAIGQRLGYPLFSARTKGHAFARWDDPKSGERINFEALLYGSTSHSDDHYREWPYPVNAFEEKDYGYLQSQTPRQLAAKMIGGRASVWLDLKDFRRAAAAYA